MVEFHQPVGELELKEELDVKQSLTDAACSTEDDGVIQLIKEEHIENARIEVLLRQSEGFRGGTDQLQVRGEAHGRDIEECTKFITHIFTHGSDADMCTTKRQVTQIISAVCHCRRLPPALRNVIKQRVQQIMKPTKGKRRKKDKTLALIEISRRLWAKGGGKAEGVIALFTKGITDDLEDESSFDSLPPIPAPLLVSETGDHHTGGRIRDKRQSVEGAVDGASVARLPFKHMDSATALYSTSALPMDLTPASDVRTVSSSKPSSSRKSHSLFDFGFPPAKSSKKAVFAERSHHSGVVRGKRQSVERAIDGASVARLPLNHMASTKWDSATALDSTSALAMYPTPAKRCLAARISRAIGTPVVARTRKWERPPRPNEQMFSK